MQRVRLWIVFSLTLLLVIGSTGLALAQKGGKAKKEPVKSNASTRDTRQLFGHNVDGLKPVTLIFASDGVFNSLGDVLTINVVKLIEAESQGKIKIDLHRHGSLYKTNDMPKVIPIGTVHIGGINKGLLMSRENGYAPWIIGYIWKSPEHLMALACSKEWYELEDRLAKGKWNLKPLVSANMGNWDYWSKTEIKSMKDFGGKKVFSYGELSNAYVAAWGGTPVMKSFGEMYMAFYSGSINVMSSSVGLFHDYKFYEGGKYYLHMPIYPPDAVGLHYYQIYMNRDKWNTLPEAYKRIILDAFDLMSWAGTYEGLCMQKLNLYRLINQHKVVDVGIATKYPQEYEKIKKAASEAGKKYVFSRGVTQKQWDETQSILNKYADPKISGKYAWWFNLVRAESARRVNLIKSQLAAGKSWEEAYDQFHPKHRYNWSVEKIKKEWTASPRVKWEWDQNTRLQ